VLGCVQEAGAGEGSQRLRAAVQPPRRLGLSPSSTSAQLVSLGEQGLAVAHQRQPRRAPAWRPPAAPSSPCAPSGAGRTPRRHGARSWSHGDDCVCARPGCAQGGARLRPQVTPQPLRPPPTHSH